MCWNVTYDTLLLEIFVSTHLSLSYFQCGFMKDQSTVTTLLSITDE